MKIVDKFALTLFCLTFALVIPMLRVQAAEDIADVNLIEREVCWTVTLENSYDSKIYTSGGNPYVVSGEGLRIYSFGFIDDVSGSIRFDIFAFSPGSIKKNGDIILSNLKSVNIDGSIVNYVSLDSFSTRLKTENDRYGWINPVWSGFPNLTMYSETKDFNFIAKGIAEDMARAGYYDYDDSEWATDREQFSYFSLSGFQCDDSVSASWNGILTDSQLIKDHVKDIEVVVSPSFFLILEPGEKYQEFPEPESYLIPINQSFKRTYDSFFEGNPYKGRALLTLDFYPRFYDSSTGNMYRGNSISVKFDVKGKITDVDFPESSLIPVYDSGCYFDSPASTTVIDSVGTQKTFFRWNKVFTSYVYKSNYIVVDIGYKGKWYSYSSDDFFSFNSISLTWKQVKDFLSDYIEEGFLTFPVVTDGYKIRYTPYYKTSSGVYYGKSIIVSVSGNATTESITEVDGDYLDTTNPPDFVDKTPTDWFEDTSIWDNVEHVTDHIKDDIEGNVDLDNLSFNFFKMLKAVINACGQFPTLVATVFSFLPTDISRLLVISLSLIIILRILGR